jgi:hypothetical protein
MRTLILAALLALPMASQADCRMQQNDSMKWKGDKRAHLIYEVGTGLAVSYINDRFNIGLSKWQQFGLAILPGFAREVATGCGDDIRAGFSHEDMAYNMLGAAIGVGLGEGVRVMLGKDSAAIEWSF